MIDSKSHRTKSIKHKKLKTNVNGDISPIANGQKLKNGTILHHTEEIEEESWNVMNYQEYVNYRSNEEESLCQYLFGHSENDFDWDYVKEVHKRRHPTTEKEESTKSISPNQKESGSTPGFVARYYQQFGFYWNVFPKTDYCYLPGSPDYKSEVSPGIPRVPNLSRPPLPTHTARCAGLKSRSVRKNDLSSAFLSEKSFASSTKIEGGSTNSFFKEGLDNVETRQNIINNILSREEKRRSAWSSVKSITQTFLTIIKKTVVMTFTTLTKAVSLSSNIKNLRIPLLLLFILLLPFLYFFIPGFAQDHRVVESVSEESVLTRFFSWLVNGFTSCLFLVKDSFLFIPTICQQLVAFSWTLYGTETPMKNEAVSVKTLDETLSVPLVSAATNLSQELIKEELITLQTIRKIKEELSGRENHITGRIDRLQEQMKQLTEDIKKMSGSFEADWMNRFNSLKEEIKQKELAVYTPNELVEKAVAKYHADRTGRPDYALQSSGGYIVRVRCTQMYSKTTAKLYLFGLPLPWDVFNGPDTIIKPGVMPGECWAFEGSFAQVTLHLATKVKITSFTMEHSPRELALHGHISSAPKQFSVWAIDSEEDENPVLLGRFTFLDNGESLQQFDSLEYDRAIDLVELKIESNHGHPEYTCLYRFRVHGVPPPVEKTTANDTINQNDHPSFPH